MSFVNRSRSRQRFESHDSRHGYLRRGARFVPALDGLEVRALLSTIVVTNANDSGAGSLRQAILVAPSGSTISFANSLKGQTIVLTSGELSISQNLTITGPGAAKLAVSGGGSSQVLEVASGANVTISGLTITDGLSTDWFWRRDRELGQPHAQKQRRHRESGGRLFHCGRRNLQQRQSHA